MHRSPLHSAARRGVVARTETAQIETVLTETAQIVGGWLALSQPPS